MVTTARHLEMACLSYIISVLLGYSCFLKFISPLGKIPVSNLTTGYECADLMVSAICKPELTH